MINNTQKAKHIVKWIKEYVSNMQNPAKALCVNVSGGVDSSLVSVLCSMTGLRTIALSLPLRSKPENHNLSIKHQEWLKKRFKNVECHVINLDSVYESFKKTLSKFDHELGLVNSKARLRMVTIYQVAAKNEGLVVGTGNAVEDFAIGFFSKFGDGAVDISPIGDLTKTEVWSLAEHLEILDEIIVVDNGSLDNTFQILLEILHKSTCHHRYYNDNFFQHLLLFERKQCLHLLECISYQYTHLETIKDLEQTYYFLHLYQ